MPKHGKYTKEQLASLYMEAEKNSSDRIRSTRLDKYGLPSINYYTAAFGSWYRFLKSIGKDITPRRYTKKIDPDRHLTPDEFIRLYSRARNTKECVQIMLLSMTPLSIHEARNLKVEDIDLDKGIIKTTCPEFKLPSEAIKSVKEYIKENPNSSDFQYPTTYGFNKRLKYLAKIAELDQPLDISTKTLNNTYNSYKEQ